MKKNTMMNSRKNHTWINSKPATFFTEDSPVKIYDRKNNLFYYHPNEEHDITFNLPAGVFHTDNKLEKLQFFQPYNLMDIGDYEHKDFPQAELLIGDNPNKASIWLDLNRILLDNQIAKHPYQPLSAFVLGHELGHRIWNRSSNANFSTPDGAKEMELNCDKYSFNNMMGIGYNPTQVEAAINYLITHSPERKQELLSFMHELHNRR
ncbi:MAG: hypothetical protein KGJ07_03705 [Patescibacteria group bacterium]|nr:hypothetical protein [Patescibacteria group bacterium]